ncbi:MAG: glycoside hydrolase family 97 protein [Bacteroidaceae bacterium]|nr:glycoside hydrolase family 97 protein [Bacteroidaceae bacterium]
MKRILSLVILLVLLLTALPQPLGAAGKKPFTLTSPDGRTTVIVEGEAPLRYHIVRDGKTLVAPSSIGLTLADGTVINRATKASRTRRLTEETDAPFYRQPHISTTCNELTFTLTDGFTLTFRAYDDGVAYRFAYTRNTPLRIASEQATFAFEGDPKVWLSHTTNEREPFAMAFQNYYEETPLSKAGNVPAFLPATVDCGGTKITLLESDLEAYPGMFLASPKSSPEGKDFKSPLLQEGTGEALLAIFPPYPKTYRMSQRRQQMHVSSAEDYICRVEGKRTFPWRVLAITDDDTQMPVNNLVYALASPNRIGDTSWIKPGKVAWDWWNAWNLKGVPFKAGINMPTYKYYIDFAAKYGIEYIVLDEGWYDPASGDMLTVIPELDLEELIAYGQQKGVDIVLWTVFNVLYEQLDEACQKYAAMGVKGFKVDFLDRNDQTGVEMAYRICEKAAQYHLFLDYHGFYAPTGLNRTYPNLLNFEGVFGMEEVKWKPEEKDMPHYDVTFPYIRMMSGNVDFTPGAMRNATRADWRPIYYSPVSQGTRCHQAAMYVVFDSPFTMFCDTPTSYEAEPDYTKFVCGIPTVWDETVIPCGRMGEYIVTARRKGSTWYIAGLTDWRARDISIPLTFLSEGDYAVTLLTDGVNADMNAEDYRLDTQFHSSGATLTIHMASGGGFVLKIGKLVIVDHL